MKSDPFHFVSIRAQIRITQLKKEAKLNYNLIRKWEL